MSNLKLGDLVKINTKHYNKFYGNFEWLEEMNTSSTNSDEKTFEDCINELIACSGTGIITSFNTFGDPKVQFNTEFFGINYLEHHYQCKDNLEIVKGITAT